MKLTLICAALLLTACAGGPIPPHWESQSHDALERFAQQYLEGNSRLAERSFSAAKAALASTGRPDLAVRAELVRCALGTAALEAGACAGFETSRSDASRDDRIYGDYVTGSLREADAKRLPARYRDIATAGGESARNNALRQMEDPVSRLVAAGVLFRLAQLSPEGLALAIETSSAQGFRRPLLAYLNVQAKLAESDGDAASVQAIRRRIDLVYESLPKTN
jgi:hypothetical protein